MSQRSSRASSTDSNTQRQAGAPPPRPDMNVSDTESDNDNNDNNVSSSLAEENNNNINGSGSNKSDTNINAAADTSSSSPADQQESSAKGDGAAGDDEEGAANNKDKASSSSSNNNDDGAASTVAPPQQKLIEYTEENMKAIRALVQKAPIMSDKFRSFMKGIAVHVEHTLVSPASPSPMIGGGAAGGGGSSGGGFFGRAATSGAGTPLNPQAGSFPGPGGAKDDGRSGGAGGSGVGGAGGADPKSKFDRNSLFSEVTVNQSAIKERTLLHRVRGIFAKVSNENFAEMTGELCALPIRQTQDSEVREIVHWIYDKAVQPEDEIYVELYANLIKELTNDISHKDSKKASAVRKALVEKCQQSFDKRVEVTSKQASTEGASETTVGSRDSAASAALKAAIARDDDPEYVRNREKTRLRANIRFLAQLFRVQMVTTKVVNYVLYSLLYGNSQGRRHKPEEYEIEMFCDLIKNVQSLLPQDVREQYLPKYLDTIRDHSNNSKTSIRVRCLLQDLLELSEHNWMSREQRRKAGMHLGPAAGTVPAANIPTGAAPSQPGAAGVGAGGVVAGAAGGGAGGVHPPFAPPGYGAAPPYGSPNSALPPTGVPPAYPGGQPQGGGGGGGGGGGRMGRHGGGSGSGNVSSPISVVPRQQAANFGKEFVLTCIENYKLSGQNSQILIDHFRLLDPELRVEHLLHLLYKSVMFVRKLDERKMICSILQVLIEARLVAHTIGCHLMNQLAGKIALEYEDNPKLFVSWSELLQMQWSSIIPPASHAALLRELIKAEVPFDIIDKMITDTTKNSSWMFQNAAEAALSRFRILPIVLSCTRDSDEDGATNDGFGDDSSMNAASASAVGGGSNNMSDPAGSQLDSNADAAAASAKRDLLGSLLFHPAHPRVNTESPSEIELDMFGLLTQTDAPMHTNLSVCLKRVKHHPQRSDPTFIAGCFCAIFCYLRIAVLTGEKTDMDRFREILAALRVPGENTQLFLRECYMTFCELGGQPAGSFMAMANLFVPQRELNAELKTFHDWKNRQTQVIQQIVGRAVLAPI